MRKTRKGNTVSEKTQWIVWYCWWVDRQRFGKRSNDRTLMFEASRMLGSLMVDGRFPSNEEEYTQANKRYIRCAFFGS